MTRASRKNTLILVLLLVLGALLAWIMALHSQDRQAMLAHILLPQDEATTISIERGDGQLEFTRTQAGWQMQSPLNAAANEQRINPVLSLLTLPSSHRYDLNEIDQARLGLDPAQATVRINQLSFDFGHLDASGQKRYLKAGNGVYLIDDLVFPLISGAPATFVAPPATQ